MNLSQDEILKLAKDIGIIISRSHYKNMYWDVLTFNEANLIAFANAIQSHSGGEAVPIANQASLMVAVQKLHEAHNQIDKFVSHVADQSARIKELEAENKILVNNHVYICDSNTELQATNAKLVEQVRDMREALAEIKLETGDTLSFTVADKALLKAGD